MATFLLRLYLDLSHFVISHKNLTLTFTPKPFTKFPFHTFFSVICIHLFLAVSFDFQPYWPPRSHFNCKNMLKNASLSMLHMARMLIKTRPPTVSDETNFLFCPRSYSHFVCSEGEHLYFVGSHSYFYSNLNLDIIEKFSSCRGVHKFLSLWEISVISSIPRARIDKNRRQPLTLWTLILRNAEYSTDALIFW